MLRILRSAAWIASLVGFITFAALWARSYFRRDALYQHRPMHYWDVVSWNGLASVKIHAKPPGANGISQPIRLSSLEGKAGYYNFLRFDWQWEPNAASISAPHWIFVIVCGVCAVWAKPRPWRRLSLLDFWVGMTLGAVALAGIGALLRNLAVDG